MKPKRQLLLIASAIALAVVGLIAWRSARHEQLYKVTVLPTLGGWKMQPTAINDKGQVVGTVEDSSGVFHLFLWDRDKGMKDLGPMDAENLDINNASEIAGSDRHA
jgi:probable HAF family extracellular repeat protein